MKARLDLCAAKGFVGVDADNIDVYDNDSGFPLTQHDALTYDLWLAKEAHARGLAIGQKNDVSSVPALVDTFDFAVTEQCFVQGWCDSFSPYVNQSKAVFQIEYTGTNVTLAAACPEALQLNFSLVLKNMNLGPTRWACNTTGTATMFHY